jgi:hypothetical protein
MATAWQILMILSLSHQSPEAEVALADADKFIVIRTHIYTKEYILK